MTERALFGFHPSRLIYWKWYILSLGIIAIGILLLLSFFGIIPFELTVIKEYDMYIFSMIPLLGLFPATIAEVLRRSDLYVLTDQRIIERVGIFNVKENSMEWRNVANYTFTQSFGEKIFGMGTIHLYSSGGVEHKAELAIKKTSHISRLKPFLDKLIQKE